MSRRVVAIYGSYRENGNSSGIIQRILDSIPDDACIEKYHLSQMTISGCRGCFGCRKTGKCVINDDMHQLIESIKAADKIILGIPVLLFQASGTIKQMLDRLYPILEGEPGRYKRSMAVKDLILVYSQGAPDEKAFQDCMELNCRSMALLGLIVRHTIICTMANAIGSFNENSRLCAQAQKIGAEMF